MNIKTFGSVCSGIECATLVFQPLGIDPVWYSEISDFQSRLLSEKYPNTLNVGDMNKIPTLMKNGDISCPDIICGGTPCQAFSLAGYKNGLNDERGNLTMKFVEILDTSDEIRNKSGLDRSFVFWENVEGVLTDKTNAFGCFISALAGIDDGLNSKRYPKAGVVKGEKRNVAWRVLDAKYFGVPQQRKRVYVVACDKKFNPENILFEKKSTNGEIKENKLKELCFTKDGHKFEIFREYTDCLYSAYGTKWNGNAGAYNGSLYVVQDEKIRRLSPLECERLMGFPDNYTNIEKAKRTQRYQSLGNSWAVCVVKWLAKRIIGYPNNQLDCTIFNTSEVPNLVIESTMKDIVTHEYVPDEIFMSPVGCSGILRRSHERGINMNIRLAEVLTETSIKMTNEEIEKRSRVQKRGRFSD